MVRAVFLAFSVLSMLVGTPKLAFLAEDLVDCPTSGLSPWGAYELSLRLEPEGGLIGRLGVGLLDRLLLRASYGGRGIIGYGSPDWNPKPEVEVRLLLLDEITLLPAFSLGFTSQGYGRYYEDGARRYRFKSKGFYGVLSKSLFHLERLDLHAGGNYTLEGTDKDPDFFFGLEQYLNPDLSVVGDLSLGLNDDEEEGFGNGEGYLNLGVRWVFAGRIAMELYFRNLTENGDEGVNRTGRIAYIDYF